MLLQNPYDDKLEKDSIFSGKRRSAVENKVSFPNVMSSDVGSIYQNASSYLAEDQEQDLDRQRQILLKAKKQLMKSYSGIVKDV